MLLYKTLLIVAVLLKEIACKCQEKHVVICDELEDINNQTTMTWRYVQIGSYDRKKQSLQVLPPDVTFKLQKTKSLTIINRLKRIKHFAFAENTFWKDINLYGNDIIEITDYTFKNFLKLSEVYLKNNNIQHLGQAIFKNTTLDIVDLSRNRIRSITTCFQQSKINWIVLNNNEIEYIANDAFPNTLQQLELSYNNLENLGPYVFDNLPKLKELYLDYNRLTTLPDIAKLKEVSYLHFAHNQIKEVDYLFHQNHPKIEFIDLSSNLIENITISAFASSETPPLVLLSFNRLTNVVFKHPEKRTDLILYGNPWNCNCLFTIEKIIKQYKHMKSCEVDFFDKGEIPLCIENGKCGTNLISKTEIDNFLKNVRGTENIIYNLCKFRL